MNLERNEKIKCKICNEEKTYGSIGKHVSFHHNVSSEEYYTSYLNFPKPVCPICNKNVEFKSIPTGYKQYCSPDCLRNALKNDSELRSKNKKNTESVILKKYGVKNVFSTNWCKDKIKNTMVEKYGVKSPIQSTEIKQKIENTNIEKYGCKNPFSNKEIINEKILPKKNYKDIHEKCKKTCLSKYGVDNFLKSEESKKVNLENIRKKMIDSIFDKNRISNDSTPLFSKDDYIDVKKKYEWKCKKCNNHFFDHIDDGSNPRCDKCYPYKNNISMYEYEIEDFLKDVLGEEIVRNDRFILNGKELDFLIPSKNIAIEFNGIYWHSELSGNKDKHYHLNKTKLCEEKNIQLIHIFENEWNNKKDIVKNKLSIILKKYGKKIHARKCNIKIISPNIKNNFLNKNHIQGEDKSNVKLGLYYQNELVSVMTFGKLRTALGQKNKKENEYELCRFCNKENYIVNGSFSKLLNYFIKNYNPIKIITYADKRYSNGNVYNKLNFKFISNTAPNYWYHKSGKKLYHRYNFTKHTLSNKLETYDHMLTEWENMQLNGYDRIWDCGNLKYELKISE
tara:strand:- start:100 stop:1791 length:1692 start_codon:yes stop_codon:yes gene_type:complete